MIKTFLTLLLSSLGRAIMQKSFSFVIDLTQVAFLVALGVFGLYVADKTPVITKRPPAQTQIPSEEKRPRILPRLRGELDTEAEARPKISLGDIHPPDGSKIQIDFPLSRDMRNIRSKVDGAGMCVTTAAEMSADWAGLEQIKGFRDWCAKERGGCGPRKFDDQLRRFCKEKGIEVPNYLFYIGKDPNVLELVLKTGRMPAISYGGFDGVQYREHIAHVNNLPHFRDGLAGIYDNNYDATRRIWMDKDSFVERWTDGGNGWAVVWLDAPPPPRIK